MSKVIDLTPKIYKLTNETDHEINLVVYLGNNAPRTTLKPGDSVKFRAILSSGSAYYSKLTSIGIKVEVEDIPVDPGDETVNNDNIVDIISNSKDGDTIKVSGKIDKEITIDKGITLKGGEFSKPIIVNSGNVSITGAKISYINEGYDGSNSKNTPAINVSGDGFSLTNSDIKSSARTVVLLNTSGKVTITDNIFTASSDNKLYNGIELGQKSSIGDGSVISNNKFIGKYGEVTHNWLSIYKVVDGATISIDNNTFECSANAIRLSNYDSKSGTFNISNNKYDSTDPNTEYAGLIIFQDTGNNDFTKYTVNITDLIGPSGSKITENGTGENQIYYVYKDDVGIVEDNQPTVNFK